MLNTKLKKHTKFLFLLLQKINNDHIIHMLAYKSISKNVACWIQQYKLLGLSITDVMDDYAILTFCCCRITPSNAH